MEKNGILDNPNNFFQEKKIFRIFQEGKKNFFSEKNSFSGEFFNHIDHKNKEIQNKDENVKRQKKVWFFFVLFFYACKKKKFPDMKLCYLLKGRK